MNQINPSGVTDNMVCAGGNDKSSCHGDSGGPFVCPDTNGRYIVHGVVSWGNPRCSTKDFYTVFARVSKYTAWIQSVMASI